MVPVVCVGTRTWLILVTQNTRKESKMKIIRSIYALIIISSILGFIYIAEMVMNFGGGYLHFALLFLFPILCTVSWYHMVNER